MRKLLALVLCLFMLTALVAGCSPSETTGTTGNTPGTTTTEGTEPAEEITLKWIGAGWLANEKSANVISQWNEQYPNIKVEYTELGNLVDTDYLKNLDI